MEDNQNFSNNQQMVKLFKTELHQRLILWMTLMIKIL